MFKKDVVDVVLESIRLNFQEQGRPQLWIPSQRVLKKGGKTLDDTGRLKNSFKFKIEDSYVEIYTDVPYSIFNQEGTKFIPSRPFVMLQNGDVTKINNLMIEEILKLWKSMK